MWRIRQKEQELDDRLKRKEKDERSSSRNSRDSSISPGSNSKTNTLASCSSNKRVSQSCYSREDEGLRDEELEEFLHSRVKRGRGAVGSRMDETGPYLPLSTDSIEPFSTSHDVRDHRVVIGPEKPPSLKSYETSSEEEEERHKDKRKKSKKSRSSSSKEHSRKHKHRSKEKSRDKKKERRSKNHK